jgi:uncharacterized oxidoreductase
MQMRGSTIFITGGSSGIGRGLAEAFHERGNQVIVTGRREQRLKELCQAHPGMRYFVLDVTDAAAIRDVSKRAIAEFPALNCVFNNAGVQMRFDFAPGSAIDEQALTGEINTNLVGAIRVAGAFLPHLARQQNATLVNVSSALAYVPRAAFPVYCATKAAVHSWTMCLRRQLRGAGVKVVELIPPYVATELGGPGKIAPPASAGRGPMPLDAFIAEAMKGLESDADEVAIGPAKNLVAAACLDRVKKVFSEMNP